MNASEQDLNTDDSFDDGIEIRHELDRNRFVLYSDGFEAGFATYEESRGTTPVRDFNHTVVHSDFRGKGLSSPLIEVALDISRAEGYSVIPSCSAVEHFIAKHSEYQDLVFEG